MKITPHLSDIVPVFICLTFVIGCGKEEEEPRELFPEILSISPNTGLEGDTVTIAVKDFEDIGDSCEVYFSGREATKVKFSGDSLDVIVPVGAETGPVLVVSDTIELQGPLFTFLPVIEGIDRLIQRVGDTVKISGRHFALELSSIEIIFAGNISNQPIASTLHDIEVIVPSGAASGIITLVVDGNETMSEDELLIVEPKDIPRNGLIFFAPLGVNVRSVVGEIEGTDNSSKTVDRFGVKDHARNFDGVASRIIYERNIPSTPSSVTYSVWVRTDEYEDGMILMNNGYRFDLRNGIFNSTYSIKTGEFSGSLVDVPFYTYENGWVNLTASYDLTTAKAYLNGELVYTKSLPGLSIYDFPNSMSLGSSSSHYFLTGDIDDVLIYDRVLSDIEVRQLYEQNVSAFTK